MKTLIQGCETAEQLEILLQMTNITSENKKNALRAYLVDGLPAKRAYARFHVTQQHFSQALLQLNKKAELAMEYATLNKSAAPHPMSILGGYQPTYGLRSKEPPGDD